MKDLMEVRVPCEGVNDPTARIIAWKVASGSQVREGDTIAELENSKATFSVCSPSAGFVEYSWEAGQEVPLGERLFCIRRENGSAAAPTAAPPGTERESVAPVFSEKARALASDLGLEPAAFAGMDFVREADVRQKADALRRKPAGVSGSGEAKGNGEPEGETVPLDRAKLLENRQLLAADRAALKSVIFHFCPAAELQEAGAGHEPPVPRLALIAYETARLLMKFQRLNAHCLGETAICYRHVHLGVAVDMGMGLKVLVIRNAETLAVAELSDRLANLLTKYSTNNLAVADVTGSTFTITDLAQESVFAFTPLLNSRQAATLGVGANITGAAGHGPGFMLSCTFDHRVNGGRLVSEFLRELSLRLDDYAAPLRKATAPPPKHCACCLQTAEELRAQGAFLLQCADPPGCICSNCLSQPKQEKDSRPAGGQTIPDWFYETNWRRKDPVHLLSEPEAGVYLVFADSLGLAEALVETLECSARRCIIVEMGGQFARRDRTRYCINARAPEDYQRLLAALSEDGLAISHIIHFGTYTEYCGEAESVESLKEAQHSGLFSLLFLVQALSPVQNRRPTRLLVVSSYAQGTSTADKIACEKAPLPAWLKSIALDEPWLRCSHIDLTCGQPEDNAWLVRRELHLARSEPESAFREGQRLVPVISKVDMLRQPSCELPLKKSGTYLVTGGLGGIGASLARCLMKELQARLILIGRTGLPDRAEWADHMRQQTSLGQRLARYSGLQAAGECLYEAVDVCDLEGLKRAVGAGEARWKQPLSGVIHLAGEGSRAAPSNTRQRQTPADAVSAAFEAAFRAKVYGTWNLWRLLDGNPDALFIAFSSVCGLFGGGAFGALAAADRFLQTFCFQKRHAGRPKTYCFTWSFWNEVGLSEGAPISAKFAAKNEGYQLVSPEQGWHSMLAGLCRHQDRLIVGLQEGAWMDRVQVESEARQTEELVAYFTGAPEASLPKCEGLEIRDDFQTPTRCEFRRVGELPRTTGGNGGRETATPRRRPAERSAAQPDHRPLTGAEKTLARIWQDLLRVPRVEPEDNFFRLGGNSLQALQMISSVRNATGVALSLAMVFKSSKLASLAEILDWELKQKETPILTGGNREQGEI